MTLMQCRRIAPLAALGLTLAATTACTADSAPTAPLAVPTAPNAAKGGNGATNVKFDFENVDLTAMGGPASAVIYASSKLTGGGNQVTVCDFATANGEESLGQFEQSGVSFTDPGELQAFCVAHFSDRQITG